MKREEFISKGSKLKFRNKYLNRLANNTFTIIVKNWVFQGFFDLSINEKIYKVLFDVIGVFIANAFGINDLYKLLFIFLLLHTLNWITNDHFVDNLYHLHICKNSPQKMEKSIKFLQRFVNKFDFIIYAGIYGRISRGDEVHIGTDIDIRIIIKRGVINYFIICFIGHYLRFIGLIKLIPIDLNIWNSPEDLKKMRQDENPLILKDVVQVAKRYSQLSNNMLIKYKKFDVRYIL